MIDNDLIFIEFPDKSDSGYTEKRIAIRLSEIVAVEEASVPTKGKSVTHIFTKHGTFKTCVGYYEAILKMMDAVDDYGRKAMGEK